MLLAVVVIVSSIVVSSAQPTSQSSSACNATYNAAFGNASNCALAFYSLFVGNATDEQRMMVCNASQQCNTMIEDIISECGDTVSSC